MSDAMSLFAERNQIREDTLAHKEPKRLLITAGFTVESAAGYAEENLTEVHYNIELREKAFRKVAEDFYSDSFPCADLRFPAVYQILGAKNWILGTTGVVQHPEIETMKVDDYEEYTAAPYKTIMETFLPRVCTGLDKDPVTNAITLAKAYATYKDVAGANFGLMGRLGMEYGHCLGFMAGQLIEAPFDFLADQLRGFKGISMDTRRCPEKVKAAVEATLPLMVELGTPSVPRPGVIDFIPLHLAPYMNMKTFETLYWPTLKALIEQLDERGVASMIYAEEDWTRYADFLTELPASTIIWFENGDYRKLKKTAGKDHIIGGFYDPCTTLTKTKEQCIDYVKELLDVCMPGGNFFFAFDKGLMDIKSVDVPKLQAVLEYVRDNAVY